MAAAWLTHFRDAETELNRRLKKINRRIRARGDDSFRTDALFPVVRKFCLALHFRHQELELPPVTAEEIFDSFGRLLDENASTDMTRRFANMVTKDTSTQSQVLQYITWLSHGRVLVEVPEGVAISLLLTDLTADSVSLLEPPWPCFAINLPRGLFKTTDGVPVEIAYIWMIRDQISVLTPIGAGGLFSYTDLCSDAQSDHSLKPVALLVAGLSFLIAQEPEMISRAKDTSGAGRQRKQGEPAPQVYLANPSGLWTENVSEARAMLEAKLSGRSYRTPRWFRRGHWRHQRVGKGKAQTKIVRVSPSWCERQQTENPHGS